MGASVLLIISVVFHYIAVLFSYRLVRPTGGSLAWKLITGALTLMAIVRTLHLYDVMTQIPPVYPNLFDESMWLVISILVTGGIITARTQVQSVKRHDEIRDVLDERNAIFQQLHEDVLRALHHVRISLEVGKPANLIISQLGNITQGIKTFLEDLKAGVLVGNNFGTALESLIENMKQDDPLPITLDVDSTAATHLTREQGTQLLHITREAVSNSQRHARAKKSRVSFHNGNDVVALEIVDNGTGFEVDLVEAQGRGLGNMVVRAKQIGARLKINSRPKQGTRILIEIPLNGDQEQN